MIPTVSTPSSGRLRTPQQRSDDSSIGLEYADDQPSTSRAAAAALSETQRTTRYSAGLPSSPQHYAKKSTSHGPHGRFNASNNQVPNSSGERRRIRKQKNPQRRRQLLFAREFNALNNRTKFLIPRLPFGRLVRDIMNSVSQNRITHCTREALEGIQESTEMYMTQVFNDAYYLTQHRKRQTLTVEDVQLLKVLRLIDY